MLRAHWPLLILLLSALTIWDATPSEPAHSVQNNQPKSQAPASSQTVAAGDEQSAKAALVFFNSLMAMAKQEAAREAADEAARKQNQSSLARIENFIVTWFNRFVSDPNAVFAFGVMLFTAVLAGVSIRQGDQQQQALKLAQQEFISTHRPRLRVRLVQVHPFADGGPVRAQYEIVNVGDTKARIITNEIRISIQAPKGINPLWAAQVAVGREIAAGEAILVAANSDIIYQALWNLTLPGSSRLQVSGVMTYMDDNGTARRTAFRRLLEDGRFRKAYGDDTDHEYED